MHVRRLQILVHAVLLDKLVHGNLFTAWLKLLQVTVPILGECVQRKLWQRLKVALSQWVQRECVP